MASVVVNGDTSGAVTLSAPAVAGTVTVTLPAASGTMLTTASTFGGTGPAFGAYQSTAQALSAGVYTKILFQTEEFDTNNNFASSTFTPTVAGYYQLNTRFRVSTAVASQNIFIYKNGSLFKDGVAVDTTSVGMQINCLVYANGTTDYFEIYGAFSNSQNTSSGQQATWFNGFLARSA
jgi:hypothetical protein